MKKIILLILLIVSLYGCVSDPERLAPPREFKTGMANYLTVPLDKTRLATAGYPLDRGWNILIWPEDAGYNDVKVESALESVEGAYYYIYNYNDETFYFPSEGKYAELKTHNYYGEMLFNTFKSGQKYNIYLSKGGVLRYSP